MSIDVLVPELGESIREAQVGRWRKAEGDIVARDEVVVELETDKAAMELPAPASGRLLKIVRREGDTVAIGDVIAHIDDTQTGGGSPPAGAPARPKTTPVAAPAGRAPPATGTDADRPAGNVELEAPTDHAAVSRSGAGREDVVPMSMLRRRIAQRLVESQRTTASCCTFNEVDLSEVMAFRRRHGEAFERQNGVKLGILSFFVRAAVHALRQVPQVNAEIRGDDIVLKHHYDIGVAVATDAGLVVPVLRGADRLSLAQIEQRIAQLAGRARDRTISVEDLTGGTFTITNGGVFGSMLSTPIINPPQAAILGLHAITDRPVARDGQVVIRPMMYLALTYDHRLVDGREAVTFLRQVKECVESPVRMLLGA